MEQKAPKPLKLYRGYVVWSYSDKERVDVATTDDGGEIWQSRDRLKEKLKILVNGATGLDVTMPYDVAGYIEEIKAELAAER